MEINSHSGEESPRVGRWEGPDLRAKYETEPSRVLLKTEKEDGNSTVSKPAKGEERRKREGKEGCANMKGEAEREGGWNHFM